MGILEYLFKKGRLARSLSVAHVLSVPLSPRAEVPECKVSIQNHAATYFVFGHFGLLLSGRYYNNLRAVEGIVHSGDETTGRPSGVQDGLAAYQVPRSPKCFWSLTTYVLAVPNSGWAKW